MEPADAGLSTLTNRERADLRRLLIHATAAAGRDTDPGSVQQLVVAAKVQALPAAALLHRVAGTVLRGLDGVDGIPTDVRARLSALRQQAALRNLLVTAMLGRIGRALDDADLPWVAMKGPVIAGRLYPDGGDRMYADLDLLVGRRHFGCAMRLLEELGFEHDIHNWALAEEMLAGQVGMRGESLSVDLHWHLHYSQTDRRPFSIAPEAMIERRRHVTVSGVRAPTLDAVDTLLTLAFHAARSDGHRLVWLKDVERSVAVDQPDLEELVRRCRAFRCAPPVGIILGRSRCLLGADVPQETVEALVPRTLRAADRVVRSLTDPVQLDERPTVTRAFTRSVRSSVAASIADVPTRLVRRVSARLFPPPENETDDVAEKERYLRAVATVVDR